jgi:cobaltochelatase CobS
MDINKYIQDIDNEILGQKEDLIKKYIDTQLKNFQFEEQNLSPNLISILMTKQDIKVPLPERKEIPTDLQDRSEDMADLINTNTAAIYTDLMVGNNVYLFGKAGTGKTTLAKKIVDKLLQRQTYVINCNQFTSPINIVGGQTIEGYKQGIMINAWRDGGVLILDELPKLDPNTAGLLNEALAQSADEKSETVIGEAEYDKLVQELLDAEGKELGFRLSIDDRGRHIKTTLITITDGKGEKIVKNKNFAVIATGNTNMKEISSNFSGNNRQDYSLVDRFAGSFYEIKYDKDLEQALTYKLVYKVAVMIREVLDLDESSIESVSLRTMLNFNRIFEQQMLREIHSKYAIDPIKIGGVVKAKTLKQSVYSFVSTLPTAKQVAIAKTGAADLAGSDVDSDEFIQEFIRMHKVDPEANSKD